MDHAITVRDLLWGCGWFALTMCAAILLGHYLRSLDID